MKVTHADSGQELFSGRVDPRRSLIVCRDNNVRFSPQLFGENSEKDKWTVDGVSYKPLRNRTLLMCCFRFLFRFSEEEEEEVEDLINT